MCKKRKKHCWGNRCFCNQCRRDLKACSVWNCGYTTHGLLFTQHKGELRDNTMNSKTCKVGSLFVVISQVTFFFLMSIPTDVALKPTKRENKLAIIKLGCIWNNSLEEKHAIQLKFKQGFLQAR